MVAVNCMTVRPRWLTCPLRTLFTCHRRRKFIVLLVAFLAMTRSKPNASLTLATVVGLATMLWLNSACRPHRHDPLLTVEGARMQIDSFISALQSFRRDVGRYPSEAEGLSALISNLKGRTGWHGPYLQAQVPADPWGRAYIYTFDETTGAFTVATLGADGQIGGVGINQDLSVTSRSSLR
jgi:type II secretion system protein G